VKDVLAQRYEHDRGVNTTPSVVQDAGEADFAD
jgi:hypothetical protein